MNLEEEEGEGNDLGASEEIDEISWEKRWRPSNGEGVPAADRNIEVNKGRMDAAECEDRKLEDIYGEHWGWCRVYLGLGWRKSCC